jgi:hypothetical protein
MGGAGIKAKSKRAKQIRSKKAVLAELGSIAQVALGTEVRRATSFA